MDLIWTSDEKMFNYDTDMSPSAAARAFAQEEWNTQFFDDLKKAHQTHQVLTRACRCARMTYI